MPDPTAPTTKASAHMSDITMPSSGPGAIPDAVAVIAGGRNPTAGTSR